MTYNRTDIMNHAWHIARQELRSRCLPASALREVFPNALRSAWKAAKIKMAYRAKLAAEAMRPVADLQAEVQQLENVDRLGHDGIERLSQARRALDAAVEREAAEAQAADYAAKRDLIAAAAGRFCAITFTKKDGTERTMQVQPATLQHHVKGNAATEAGQKATATRKERHPHLLPVWDAKAKAPRSVNLATISRIAVNGTVHEYHPC